jgi:hypothetical protein
MGNFFAYFVLFSWPLVAIAFYSSRKGRSSVATTTAWALLLPIMFLPSNMEWDPPLLPPFNKFRIALLSVLICLRIFHAQAPLKRAPGHNMPRILFAIYMAGVLGTTYTNGDSMQFGKTFLQGMTLYDVLSVGIAQFLDIYLPFAIGQRVFKDEAALLDLFKVLTTGALIYAPLMLWEIRFSPQLHNKIYGYHPSDFIQSMRQGGFRPIVFMNHGLSVAAWIYSCVVATLGLKVAGVTFPKVSVKQRLYLNYFLLLITKSMGPLIYGMIAGLSRFWSNKVSARIVLVVALLVATYPVLRAEDIFPTEKVLNFFASLDHERMLSLKFRFDNEDLLLHHAEKRPVFGWGTFGRNRVYDQTGKDISVTDGEWIIQLGAFGYVGHLTFFSMLLFPLFRYLRLRKKMAPRQQNLCTLLALLVALFVLDLIPNARSDYLSLMYAGTLWTIAERFTRRVPAAKAAPPRPRPERDETRGSPEAEPSPIVA